MGLTINDCIIDSIERKREWFYHGISGDESTYDDIFKNGLKSPILLHKSGSGWNGPFYVSLSKIINECDKSSYELISASRLSFIIENILAYKTSLHKYDIFQNTIFPLRPSEYQDEYQRFLYVDPKHFIGLQYSKTLLEEHFSKKDDMNYIIKSILEYLLLVESNMPFYTFEDPFKELYIMDKEKTLKVINSSILKNN